MTDQSDAPKPPAEKKKPIYTRPKFILSVVAAIIFLILIFQNMETITVDVFFMPLKAPAALLYLIFSLVGFIVGWLIRRPKKNQS